MESLSNTTAIKNKFIAFITEKISKDIQIPYLSMHALNMAIDDLNNIKVTVDEKDNNPDEYNQFCQIYQSWKHNVRLLQSFNTGNNTPPQSIMDKYPIGQHNSFSNFATIFSEIDREDVFVSSC